MQSSPVPSHPRPEWIKRFVRHAMRVQPAFDCLSAEMIADSQFDDAADLEPEQAAEIFATPH